MFVQLLRLLGFAAFLFTGLVIVAGLALMLIAVFTERPRLLTVTATAVTAWFACYAIAVLAGPALTPRRTLAVGEEMEFCGLDCHLHLSVAGIRRDSGLAVTVRFRSDARAAPEYPSHLRIRVIDAAGREHAPLESAPLAPLPAGAEYLRDLHFDLPAGAAPDRLVATWGDWPDYIVPGPENAMVQRRRSVRLTPASGPAA